MSDHRFLGESLDKHPLKGYSCSYVDDGGYAQVDTEVYVAEFIEEAREHFYEVWGSSVELFERTDMSRVELELELHRQFMGEIF